MRSFKTTATILVLGALASKLIVAYNTNPIYNRWEGEVVVPAKSYLQKETGTTVEIQLWDASQKLTMEFSGDPAALATAGLPSGKITCTQDEVQKLGKHHFDRYYKLATTSEPWIKNSDPNWCTGLFVRVDGPDEIQIGFADKQLLANLHKNNNRGFLVGYMQDKHFNYSYYK
jgi:hypothetical protein